MRELRCRVYDLALFSYLFALLHFGSEIFVFRSVKLQAPIFSPVVVACESHHEGAGPCYIGPSLT